MKKQNSTDAVTQQIQNLGFDKNISANQLAAQGVQLSMKEVLRQKLIDDKGKENAEMKESEAIVQVTLPEATEAEIEAVEEEEEEEDRVS